MKYVAIVFTAGAYFGASALLIAQQHQVIKQMTRVRFRNGGHIGVKLSDASSN